MQITGVSLNDFDKTVQDVSERLYKGNLVTHQDSKDLGGVRAPRIRARVTVKSIGYHEGLPVSETLPGVRRSSSEFSRNANGDLRRVHAACWHAYRDVLTELFERHPKAVVRTAMAKYEGAAGFEYAFPATGYTNIGSLVFPMYAREACDCE